MKRIIFIIFIIFIVSCDKTNNHIIIDKKSKLSLEIMMKNLYYSDKDIIINGKIVNKSQNDIYISNANVYCRLYKRDGEIFYPIEPILSITERYVSKPVKINIQPILLKSNEFKEFTCEYYSYVLDYKQYEPRNLYPIKPGAYKMYFGYSSGVDKIDKKEEFISIHEDILFKVKSEWSFFVIISIIIGLLLILCLSIKLIYLKKQYFKKLLKCLFRKSLEKIEERE